jgi:hypothetical protein
VKARPRARERGRGVGEKVTKRESESERMKARTHATEAGRFGGGVMQHYCANNHIILSRT